jgi:hypothetical protein
MISERPLNAGELSLQSQSGEHDTQQAPLAADRCLRVIDADFGWRASASNDSSGVDQQVVDEHAISASAPVSST